MNQTRLNNLKTELQTASLDGIVLMPGPNMVYISHIHSHVSERPILLFLFADAPPAAIIPNLEAMKAEAAGVPKERIFGWSDEDGFEGAFAAAGEALGLAGKKLGVEALHMRVLEHDTLKTAVPTLTLKHADHVMAALRMVKDDSEIAAMQKAVHVAEKAMQNLLPQLSIGQTEKQIAAMLRDEMLQAGADSIAFTIVSGGPNSASPHAVPTDRPIQAGDLLVIDWGCIVDGYPSDITRTFAVGDIDAERQRIYNAVKLANEQGKAIAAPGKTGQQVDSAAREVIEEAGYAQYFIHRTGHGRGIEAHEPPLMSAVYTEQLVEGNVFTVEPGIYLPGKAGVRIEDDVVVTADGVRSLTTFPRDLITIGK